MLKVQLPKIDLIDYKLYQNGVGKNAYLNVLV